MKINTLVVLSVVSILAGCGHNDSGNHILNKQQEILDKQAALAIGMPAITNFAEKRELKMIYELRDKEIPTWSYLKGMHGHLHFLCHSVGYGIPYSTQYTNPDRVHFYPDHHGQVLPQADPNGLYSPAEAAGTWILCLDPDTKKMAPMYVEPNVLVSPYKLAPSQVK